MAVERDVRKRDALSRRTHLRRETCGKVSENISFYGTRFAYVRTLTRLWLIIRENLTPHHRLQTYFGYSFESFSTAGTPHAKPGWGGDVDTSIQWCSVVKTKLGNTRLVIGGEVDCVRGASRPFFTLSF